MPLIKGYSRASISKNIRESIHAGKPQAQAVAIALKVAREAFEARHPKRKTLPGYLRPALNPKPSPELVASLVAAAGVTTTQAKQIAKKLPCGCRRAPPEPKDAGELVKRAVYEAKGHRIDELPKGKGVVVHPDHRWFPDLAAAKKWLKGHAAHK